VVPHKEVVTYNLKLDTNLQGVPLPLKEAAILQATHPNKTEEVTFNKAEEDTFRHNLVKQVTHLSKTEEVIFNNNRRKGTLSRALSSLFRIPHEEDRRATSAMYNNNLLMMAEAFFNLPMALLPSRPDQPTFAQETIRRPP